MILVLLLSVLVPVRGRQCRQCQGCRRSRLDLSYFEGRWNPLLRYRWETFEVVPCIGVSVCTPLVYSILYTVGCESGYISTPPGCNISSSFRASFSHAGNEGLYYYNRNYVRQGDRSRIWAG